MQSRWPEDAERVFPRGGWHTPEPDPADETTHGPRHHPTRIAEEDAGDAAQLAADAARCATREAVRELAGSEPDGKAARPRPAPSARRRRCCCAARPNAPCGRRGYTTPI